jgi:hypothetical protein
VLNRSASIAQTVGAYMALASSVEVPRLGKARMATHCSSRPQSWRDTTVVHRTRCAKPGGNRADGKPKKLTRGPDARVSLTEAREAARTALRA